MVSVALLLVLVGALLLVVGRALLLLLRLVVGLEDGLALGLVPVVSEPGVIMIILDQRYSWWTVQTSMETVQWRSKDLL